MNSPVYLVDASIYIFRAYFSLPDQWHSPDGDSVNAVFGYLKVLLELREYVSRHGGRLAVAFDESLGTCFRNRIYPQYKCSRALPDDALAFQLQACRQATEMLQLDCHSGPEYEADDYIASLAALARAGKIPVVVVTRDKDLGQLLRSSEDEWWDYAADTRYDRNAFHQRFSVWPEQFADYLALVGDAVDDIPGVPGIGAKGAATLLSEIGTLDEILDQPERAAQLPTRGSRRIAERLSEYAEQARVSRRLATLAEDIDVTLPQATASTVGSEVRDYLAELGLERALGARLSRFTRNQEARV